VLDVLAETARQREVMETIADAVVAAAGGRTLRVAVVSTRADRVWFVDALIEALHRRGWDRQRPTARGSASAWADAAGRATGACVVATPTHSELTSKTAAASGTVSASGSARDGGTTNLYPT
jgi:hypothetical protein